MGTRIRLCGRLEVQLGDRRVEDRLPGRQGPLVIALLALNRHRPVPRSELIDVLWPADLPADPDEALSALLAKVRKAVGREVLAGRRDLTLTLPAGAEVDVEVAFEAAETAERALANGDAAAAWDAAQAAIEITERGFLVGHEGPWVQEQREQADELRLRAVELGAQAGVQLGGARLQGAERLARALVRDAPLREAGHRLLMEALAQRGEVAEALGAYEQLRVLLRDELGMSPGERVRALHGRLLTGEPTPPLGGPVPPASLSAPTAPPPTGTATSRPPLPRALARHQGTAFVGRSPEATRLLDRWNESSSADAKVVLIAGGPGIGKTRLVSELAQSVREAGGAVLYGGCEEDAVVGYQPFVEALRHLVRHAPPAGDLGPGAAELARLVPELATSAAPQPAAIEEPETRRYFLFEAIAAVLAEATAAAPLLLVLDDLHWADGATLRLLRHLIRSDQLSRLLVVGTYRDTEVEGRHPLSEVVGELRRQGALDRIELRGLDAGAVGALIAEHTGHHVAPALGDAIHAETDGNPFFIGEVVRHLVETGADLDAEGRAAHATRVQLGVPAGVKEVLELRLARLSDDCQAMLATAAVLGRQFRLDVLAATAEIDVEAAIGALEEALGARFITEQSGSGAPVYSFVHALVRETLLEGLSAARAQRVHNQAISAISQAADFDEDARLAALATHSRLAGVAADPQQSIDLCLRAGERARQLCAWDEALGHLDGALAGMERIDAPLPFRAQLLVGLAELAIVAGDLGRHIAYLERALALEQELGNLERAAQVHSRLGVAHAHVDSIQGDHLDLARAFEHFDAAAATLGQGPPRTARGHLDTGVAWALTYALDIDRGREAARRAMDFAEQKGDELLWTSAAQPYAWHCIVGGDLAEGFSTLERSFAVADDHRRAFLAFMATNTRGQLMWGLGAPAEARPYLARPLELPYVGRTAFRQEIADGLGRCHLSLGELSHARGALPDARAAWISHALAPLLDLWDGEWDRVEATAGRVLATSRRSGNRWDEWASLYLAGRVDLLRGHPAAAVDQLTDALAIVVGGGAVYFELWVRAELARALAATGRVGEAREHVDRCDAIVGNGEDWRGRAGLVAVADAVVLAHEGSTGAATARFAEAEAVLRAHGLVAELADSLHQCGVVLLRSGDTSTARDQLDAAAALYAEHGAGRVWSARVAADRRLLTP